MGAVASCLRTIVNAIGAFFMAIINGIGAVCKSHLLPPSDFVRVCANALVVSALVRGIVAIFDAIINCICCGKGGSRSRV